MLKFNTNITKTLLLGEAKTHYVAMIIVN